MHWIELTLFQKEPKTRVKKVLCNLELVTSIEDCHVYDRGTRIQYDAENYFYVEETPEQVLAMPLCSKS